MVLGFNTRGEVFYERFHGFAPWEPPSPDHHGQTGGYVSRTGFVTDAMDGPIPTSTPLRSTAHAPGD
ncbi:MAG: hypothetical protein ACLSHU_08240 [Oscillospiraceae bacterium]